MRTETKILGIGMTQANVPKTMDGRKTQTRRIVNVGHKDLKFDAAIRLPDFNGKTCWELERNGALNAQVSAKHAVGDRLYVKETLAKIVISGEDFASYKSDSSRTMEPNIDVGIPSHRPWQSDDGKPWKNKVIPARYMPRSVARTFIEITDVKCERINDITLEDIQAEGIQSLFGKQSIDPTMLARFIDLWEEASGKGAWERNDWVFAYTFKLVEAPQ